MPLPLLALMIAAQSGGKFASPHALSPAMRSRLLGAMPKGPKNAIMAGQVLVKLRPSVAESLVPQGAAGAVSRAMADQIVPGGEVVSQIGRSGWTLWRVPVGTDIRGLAAVLKTRPGVLAAEPVNRIYTLLNDPNDADWSVEETSEDLILYFGDGDPTDFRRLWHIDDTNAFSGWNVWPNTYYTAGNKPNNAPLVAVIDTGCDMDHPDFVNAGGAGSDVTQGGQLDKTLSARFELGEQVPGSTDDLNGHGTHVAGLALAAANNGAFDGHGVVGTGYACRGMILRVFDDQGTGTDADAAAAIYYAADHGAVVINLSLGTTNYGQLFQDAVTYAFQKGSLVVAAGNENGSGGGDLGPIYPAACSGALAVEANGPNGVPATGTYSGYGSYVDIAAPGGDLLQDSEQLTIQFVYSTATRDPDAALVNNPNVYPPYTTEYTYLAGTSMATPQVSGAAGLYFGKNSLTQTSGWGNVRTYRALERSAAGVMGAPHGSWEYYQGYGCLDVESLLLDYDARGATVGAAEGIVYTNGTPIANVAVKAKKTVGGTVTYSTTTHADGTYRFESLPPGVYTVTTAPFGQVKSKSANILAGSDATNFDFWCGTYTGDETPPVVPRFDLTTTSRGFTLNHWAYDTETSLDKMTLRLGSTPGAANLMPETEVFADTPTIAKEVRMPLYYVLQGRYTNGGGMTTTYTKGVIADVEDAYVRDGAYANTNFGSAQEMVVRNTPLAGYSRRSYLKIDTTSIPGSLSSVKLKLTASRWAGGFATAPIQFFPTGSAWSQSSITWNSAPAATGAAIASLTVNSPTYTPTTYEVDITAYVQAQRAAGHPIVSLLVASPTATDGLDLYTSESGKTAPQISVVAQG